MAGTEVIRILLNKGKIKPAPYYFQFDPYLHSFRCGKLYWGNRHPIQKAKSIIVRKLLKRNQNAFRQEIPEIPRVRIDSDPIPDPILHYILRAGIQASSGDNVQPWKFQVNENTISLYLDRNADNSFFNVNQLASIISCGAVIENMRIAATLFGLAADIKLLPDDRNESLMATVSLSNSGCESDPLSAMIWQRQTNRKFYSKAPIPESDLECILKTADAFPGVKLHL
jgi:hypothetical protein